MSISRVADRALHLRLGIDHMPNRRSDLAEQYDYHDREFDRECEIARVTAPMYFGKNVPTVNTTAMWDAHCAIRNALYCVGGSLFESQVYYAVHRYSEAYGVILEFRGWKPALSIVDPESPSVVVLHPRAAFSYRLGDPTLDGAAGMALDIINGWSFREPDDVVAKMTTETVAKESFIRYWSVAVPGVGTLVRRFQRICYGPWRPMDYPNGYLGTIVL